MPTIAVVFSSQKQAEGAANELSARGITEVSVDASQNNRQPVYDASSVAGIPVFSLSPADITGTVPVSGFVLTATVPDDRMDEVDSIIKQYTD
ncbi:Hypothetical protein LUCI_4268 [Lucifera butyrica]|uniref:Uncharacterized protein n=1 Tax=Lucifera butyrica TaxID=1351585 RepID=A0A498RFX7_9FIRM|nr:hypothetical protein [Lucifera butyrica]VBB08982.1 Hypothetical protein LUCI_4268 [Lucifera butyrica]